MKEIELKDIDALKVFKVLIIMFAICLFIMGLFASFYGLAIGGFSRFLKAFFGAVIFTAIMAPFYAIMASVIVLIYNMTAKWVGGIKITLNIEDK